MTGWRKILIVAGALAASSASAAEIHGVWLRDDGNARVQIAPCGGKICATNLWIGDTSKGEAVGDRLVMTLARQPDGRFSGTAYDAKRDWSFSINIEATAKALTMQGCLLGGLLCRDVNWKAAE